MNEITVAIPILWRPERIKAVISDFKPYDVDLLFLPDEDDEETISELEECEATYSIAHKAKKFGVPTYETKINHAYQTTRTPYLLYAADDIEPQKGWLRNALNILTQNPHVGLLAADDGSHPLVHKGKLATHGIVRRSYVEKHGSASHPDAGPIFYEGYRHWGCDAEASYVARQRGAFHYSPNVRLFHKRRQTIKKHGEDKTYLLGSKYAEQDKELMKKRCAGWPEVKQNS